MLATARYKFGIRKRSYGRGLASRCDIEWRAHAVERCDKAGMPIAPTNAFGGKAEDFGKGAGNKHIVVPAGQFQSGWTIVIHIFAIGLVKHQYAIPG